MRRSLDTRNLAKRFVDAESDSANQLGSWLDDRRVTDVDDVTRGQVSDFFAHLVEVRSASTASVRYRALQQFFNWPVDEKEIESSPMARM